MRILVTGGAGFIGSHIVDAYIAAGHDVLILDDLSTGKVENVNVQARMECLDLQEFEQVDRLIAAYKPEIINHHAAQIDVRKSVADPLFDAQVNVLASVHLFQSAANNGVRGIIFPSSGGTVYGETTKAAAETYSKAPVSPYAAAKLSVEGYLFSYARTRQLPSITLRYGNVFGPRQDPMGEAGVISIFAGQMIDRSQPVIFGDGTDVRDYIMVDDVACANERAMGFLLEGYRPPETVDDAAFNIGSGASTSVSDLYHLIAGVLKSETKPVHQDARPGDLRESRLDVWKADDVLSFRPAVTLSHGIERTIQWLLVSGKED